MGEVINLRSFRKKKQRAERQCTASQNRAKAGRDKGQRQRDAKDEKATVAFLEEHRLEKDDGEEAS